MSDVVEFLASRLRSLTPEKWDNFVRSLDQRFRVLEEQLGIERRVTDQILQRGLQVIEDGIGPAIIQAEEAAANVAAMSDLGLVFFATSSTSMTINANAKTLTIPASSRAQFAPALYVAVFAAGQLANGFVGRRTSYNRATGVLNLAVEQTFGAGTFAAWEIGPIATTPDLEALRDQIVTDKAATLLAREQAVTAAGQSSGAATASGNSAAASQLALQNFQAIWFGARTTEPATSLLGAQYLDTSQTPNVVKVLTASGWAPTVTVSIGGSRMQTYIAADGQTGPFAVDGGFSIGSVVLNGATLHHGNGVTLDPGAGTFTFAAPLAAGDFVAFEGYLANDVTDIYTKAEADTLLAQKAGATATTNALATKADADATASALATKADAAAMASALAEKLNKAGGTVTGPLILEDALTSPRGTMQFAPTDAGGLYVVASSVHGGDAAPYIAGRNAVNSGWAFGAAFRWLRELQRWAFGAPVEFRGSGKTLRIGDANSDTTQNSIRSSAINLIINAASGGALYLNLDSGGTVHVGPSALDVLAFASHTGQVQPAQQVLRPDTLNGIGSYCVAVYTTAPASIQQEGNTFAGSTLGDPNNTGRRPWSGTWRGCGYLGMVGTNAVHLWQRIA